METPLKRPPALPSPLKRGLGRGGGRPIPPLPNIQQQFVLATAKAFERSSIGQTFFGGTAEAIDCHLSTALDKAPPDLLPYLRAFCTQVANISLSFHQAYTSGTPPPLPLTLESPSITHRGGPTPSPTPSPPLAPAEKCSYAQTAKSALAPENPTSATTIPPLSLSSSPVTSRIQKSKNKNKSLQAKSDLRVFIRLPLNSPERHHSALAIFLALCDPKIGCKELVQEVLSVNSGFAIVPKDKEALKTLLTTKKAFIQTLFSVAKIESSQNWAAYRLSGIPRSIEAVEINNKGAITATLVPTTAEVVATAIKERIGIAPTKVDISSKSLTSELFFTTWTVFFKEEEAQDHAIPDTTSLLGRRVFFKPLPKVSTVVQCSRCWGWHNQRNCGKNQRCRLCGTTQHSEDFHPKCLNHTQCKLKCLHCSGPHPSDDPKCLLRPGPLGIRPSTENKRNIYQASNEMRIRSELDSPCSSQDLANPATPQSRIDSSSTIPASPTTLPQTDDIDIDTSEDTPMEEASHGLSRRRTRARARSDTIIGPI